MRSTELEDPVAKATALLWRDRQLRRSEWDFEGEDLLLCNGCIYVLDATDLQRRIIAQHHDSLIAGHPRRWKTLKLILRSYWWPNMSRMIGKYTSTCNTCLRNKILQRKPLGELNPIAPPKNCWGRMSVDFIGELPVAHSFNAIMACVDSVSKRAHFIPTYTRVDSPGTAVLYRDHVWKLHRLSDEVLTDWGPQFTLVMLKELYQMLGIKRMLTTSYHPQSDGQTKQINQEIERFLRIFCNHLQDDCDQLLTLAKFSYNNLVYSTTQSTPFMLNTGCNPRMGFEPLEAPTTDEAAGEFASRMKAAVEVAKATISKAQEEYALYYN
jgi:hypothetical protein